MSSASVEKVFETMDTPVGKLYLVASDVGLCAVVWDFEKYQKERTGQIFLTHSQNHPILSKAKTQLAEYFHNERKSFNVPLAPEGTSFQLVAWRELENIPYGKTVSYAEQALAMGDEKKARAVGVANSKNPLSIIVPCHRVIGKNGDLRGYAGGLKNKAELIALERQNQLV